MNALKKRDGSQGLRVAAENAILGNKPPKARVPLTELMKDPDSLNMINDRSHAPIPPMSKPPL